jgi:hypothetical protein
MQVRKKFKTYFIESNIKLTNLQDKTLWIALRDQPDI